MFILCSKFHHSWRGAHYYFWKSTRKLILLWLITWSCSVKCFMSCCNQSSVFFKFHLKPQVLMDVVFFPPLIRLQLSLQALWFGNLFVCIVRVTHYFYTLPSDSNVWPLVFPFPSHHGAVVPSYCPFLHLPPDVEVLLVLEGCRSQQIHFLPFKAWLRQLDSMEKILILESRRFGFKS